MLQYKRIELLIIRSPKSMKEKLAESPLVSDATSAHAFFITLTGSFSTRDCGKAITSLQSICPEGVYPAAQGDLLTIRLLLTGKYRTYEDFALHTAEVLEHVYEIVGHVDRAMV